MTTRAVIGAAAALMLLVGACTGGPSPAGPTASSAPTQVRVASPTSPAPAGTATPAKAEEAKEKAPSSGEEAPEGAPMPNPLPTVAPLPPVSASGEQAYAPAPGADITKNGAAASVHGSAAAGQTVFIVNCWACHGIEGKAGVPNPGSDDGTVPPLNPIDPGFAAGAKGDPSTFAREIDLYIQHGSRPPGPNPALSMPPWGDQKQLTQQEIADVEAYVMQLNGVSWP